MGKAIALLLIHKQSRANEVNIQSRLRMEHEEVKAELA